MPWWWAWWIRLSWPLARLNGFVAAPLQKLSFIHAARWGLVARWPPDRAARRDRGAPRSLLFLTTFDGSAVQYIEAFVRVVPWRITGLYGGATGFPGVHRSRPVEAYIRTHSHEVEHFWCAHPDATVTMTRQALELDAHYEAFLAGDRSDAAWERFTTRVQALL